MWQQCQAGSSGFVWPKHDRSLGLFLPAFEIAGSGTLYMFGNGLITERSYKEWSKKQFRAEREFSFTPAAGDACGGPTLPRPLAAAPGP